MSVVDVDEEGHVIVALKKSFKFDINLDKDVEQAQFFNYQSWLPSNFERLHG